MTKLWLYGPIRSLEMIFVQKRTSAFYFLQTQFWNVDSFYRPMSIFQVTFNTQTHLTLKDMGFLVFQIHGGGDSTHFKKRTVSPPNFILEQQTVSDMKAEVFCQNLISYWGCRGWNWGLRRSPNWPRSRRHKNRS